VRRAMKWLVTLPILASAFGADPGTIQQRATALVERADQSAKLGQNAEAEEGYKAAIRECDAMPPDQYHCKTGVLWSLGHFYSRVKDRERAEATYKERLEVLLANQIAGKRPDLDVGIAFFDLQSILSNPFDTSRDADESRYMKQARAFYESCKASFPDLREICDRRQVDVEGMHGSLLFLRKRFDEAAPFLKAVTDRPDSGVRKEIMTAALKAQATILISKGQAAEAQGLMDRVRRLEAAPGR